MARYDISGDSWKDPGAAADRRQPPRDHRHGRAPLRARRQPPSRRAGCEVGAPVPLRARGATAGGGSPTRRPSARRSASSRSATASTRPAATRRQTRSCARSRSTTSRRDRWRRDGATMPTGRNHVGAARLGATMVVTGGRPGPDHGGLTRSSATTRDAIAGRSSPPLETARSGHATVAVGGWARRPSAARSSTAARRSSRSSSTTRAADRWRALPDMVTPAPRPRRRRPQGPRLRARGRPAAGAQLTRGRSSTWTSGRLSFRAGLSPQPQQLASSRASPWQAAELSALFGDAYHCSTNGRMTEVSTVAHLCTAPQALSANGTSRSGFSTVASW